MPPKKDITKTTKKRGDATITRAKIIEAAADLFVERDYESVGMREIASKAGVTAAMINRYFGTKESLFIELMGNAFSFEFFTKCERHEYGETVASSMFEPCGPFKDEEEHNKHFKSFQIVMRSATLDGAHPQIQEYLDKQLWQPLIKWLGGKNAHERAELIVSTLIGFVLMHKKIGSPSQSKSNIELLRTMLATTLQNYVDAG